MSCCQHTYSRTAIVKKFVPQNRICSWYKFMEVEWRHQLKLLEMVVGISLLFFGGIQFFFSLNEKIQFYLLVACETFIYSIRLDLKGLEFLTIYSFSVLQHRRLQALRRKTFDVNRSREQIRVHQPCSLDCYFRRECVNISLSWRFP